ncbi:hypothetical protein Scep_021879 [Stephania cephalantha]|uniref:Uncharacterized protein n=1 Tax=Stephania cephalantha TaxID=152367 RepID=A0AAP0F6V0_9MAGN
MATWACLGARVGDSADLASAARGQVLGQLDATTGGNLVTRNTFHDRGNVAKHYTGSEIVVDLLFAWFATQWICTHCHKKDEKLVQEAVDTLLDNGIRGQPMRDGHNKVYKSFSDVIEGNEGSFRETLLGKRVDY